MKRLILEHPTVSHSPIVRKSEGAGRLFFERFILRTTGRKSAGKMHVYNKSGSEWKYSHTVSLVAELGRGK